MWSNYYMKILAPLLYASVQRPSAWSFMGIRVKIERKDAFKECYLIFNYQIKPICIYET